MQPSRIVKSAHVRAGLKISVKTFARRVASGTIAADWRLVEACQQWLARKGCKL